MSKSRLLLGMQLGLFMLLLWVGAAVTLSADAQSRPSLTTTVPALAGASQTGSPQRPLLMAQLGHSSAVTSVAFSPDGKYVLTGSRDNTAILWQTDTGKQVRLFQEHTGDVASVAFSSDGKYVLTGSDDGTTILWQTETGKQLCRLITFDDGTWAVTDPQGRYDASNAGDVAGLHWVVGLHTIDLAQLKERYYEPGLLAKIFAKKPLRQVEAFQNVPLFPEITHQTLEGNHLSVTLADQGGGIGKVQVYVNNVLFLEDARPLDMRDPSAKTLTFSVDVSAAPTLQPGQDNSIRVVPFNAAGWLPARGVELITRSSSPEARVVRHLYAIVVGINDYAAPELHLRFAAQDALRFAQALQRGARNFFGADRVTLLLLTTADTTIRPDLLKPMLPTKSNITAAFESIRQQAKPEDVVVVYFAGHGVALATDNSLYCYLTQNANSADTTKLNQDLDLRRNTTVSSTELADWMTGEHGIRANYRVMVLDTCAAGAAEKNLSEPAHRDPQGDQIRAMERFKDRTGFHLLMGCAADRVSYEASRYDEGVLTYALLEGMKGAALREGAWVDVRTLFGYAEDEVPHLAGDIGGIQQPRYQKPGGAGSFDIGKMEEADRKSITLATAMPQLLRPRLGNKADGVDDLDLETRLRSRLLDTFSAVPRGGSASVGAVYVDAEELSGAVRPFGQYTEEGNKVTVTVTLLRDKQRIGSPLNVEGAKNDLDGLTAKLADAITKAVKQ